MSNPSRDDLERLANRLAMLASPDGEADNAGRAVGQLARRLGLSGGDLKQMFLAGAGQPARKPSEPADVATLRREITELEGALRQTIAERDEARAQLTHVKLGEYRQRANRRGKMMMVAAVVPVAILALLGVAMFGPDLSVTRQAPEQRSAITAPTQAIVRNRAALLYKEPDRVSPVLSTLGAGSPLSVRKLLWNMMTHWAEVETPAGVGYVAVTDVELR